MMAMGQGQERQQPEVEVEGARGSKNNGFIGPKLRNIKSFRSLNLKKLVPEP